MSADGEHRVFRHGGVSYLRIPAVDSRRSAAFYEAIFGPRNLVGAWRHVGTG